MWCKGMEPQQPSVVKHDAAFGQSGANAAHRKIAVRTRTVATRVSVRTAEKGEQCQFYRAYKGAVWKSLVFSTSSVGCQTEAVIQEVDIDLAKTGASCETCCKFFFTEDSADRHWRIQHSVESPQGLQEPYFCPYCSFSSYARKYAQHHEGTHAEKAFVLCSSTQGGCLQDGSPLVYAVEPTNESPLACRFCSKRFSTEQYRISHEKFHARAAIHTCEFCPQRFTRKSERDMHRRSHTGQRLFVCDICQRSFCRKGDLESHVRRHMNKKPFECAICQGRFPCKDDLVAHAELHKKEKPFECDVCHRRFPHRAHLVTHRKTHEQGEGISNLYSCNVCQRSFAQSCHLMLHKKVHTDPVVNDLSCTISPQMPVYRSSPTAHEKVHVEPSAAKTYSCVTCQESFWHEEALQEHERSTHPGVGEKPLVCIVCHKTFPHKMGLLSHHCTLITTRMIAASASLDRLT